MTLPEEQGISKHVSPFIRMSRSERIAIVQAVAENCKSDILESNASRALLSSFEGLNNLALEQSGATNAARFVRAAVVHRLLLLVERSFDRVTRPGDRHAAVAIHLLSDPSIFEAVASTGDREQLEYAVRLWTQLNDDPRRTSLRHFRDKFIAHRAVPNPKKGPAYLNELHAFASTTSLMWGRLALGTGASLDDINDLSAADVESARAFWKPWRHSPDRTSRP